MPAIKLSNQESVFQLKLTLQHVQPAVWRRVLVPADIPLGALHFVLNEAMGWDCKHMHSFAIAERRFSDPSNDPDGDLGFENEHEAELGSLVSVGKKLTYAYDAGDGWLHEVDVEQRLEADERLGYPLCIGGARACPPEDCGGPPGYADLLQALANKEHPKHGEMLTWVGGYFDPEGFDANRINGVLTQMFRGCGCDDGDCEHAGGEGCECGDCGCAAEDEVASGCGCGSKPHRH
jgi:hypothetical protein